MNRFMWVSPSSLAGAACAQATTVADAMRTPSGQPPTDATVVKAGGIDLIDLMKEGLLTPRRVVNLRDIPELARIDEAADSGLRIGSMVTLARLADHPLVRARYGALAQATGQAASPQIRSMATIGGNLLQRPRCWYFRSLHHHCLRKGGEACFAFAGENQYHAIFDHSGCAMVHPSTAATALVAFGAKLELIDARGATRIVALESFFLLPGEDVERENALMPGEIVTAVLLPASEPETRSAYLRQGELQSFDWPLADVAAVIVTDAGGICRRTSIVLGAAAPVPHRAREAEAVLTGKRVSDHVARDAAAAALAGAAPLSKNAYKIPLFETLVRRTILAATGEG